jgi:hypothetical protein
LIAISTLPATLAKVDDAQKIHLRSPAVLHGGARHLRKKMFSPVHSQLTLSIADFVRVD